MAIGWTDCTAYQKIQDELAVRTADDFERYALCLLHLIWTNVIGTPRRRKFDRKGADHLVWSDDPPFPVVVQCKGWEMMEDELGKSQIDQCLKSIESFQKGGLTTDHYIIVHNRTGKNQEFRRAVQEKLKTLEDSGKAKKAELWSRQQFAQEAFESVYRRCMLNLPLFNVSKFRNFELIEKVQWEPIANVPLKSSILSVDQYRLAKSGKDESKVADPCREILTADENISILVGPAGYGKSTTAFRLAQTDTRKVIYVPAAAITKNVHTTADLLKEVFNLEDMLHDSLPEDRAVHEMVARAVFSKLLKQKETPLLMIVDGLDESVFFARKGGLQHLFNLIKEDVAIPVVLTARSEYWHNKEVDFSTCFGPVSKKSPRKVREFRFIELQEWNEDAMLNLVRQVKQQTSEQGSLARIDRLEKLISSNQYGEFYGDIPKRPLFLRFIVETVLETDPHKVGRAQLFREWTCQKILRDLGNPKQFGGRRIPILSEQNDRTTIEIAFIAMTNAAALMTRVEKGAIDLLPFCRLDRLSTSHPRLNNISDSLGVTLNSLLIPISTSLGEASQIGFAHRSFQEYFLARAINEKVIDVDEGIFSLAVQEWLKDLRSEHQT